jgi:hypothetical protein
MAMRDATATDNNATKARQLLRDAGYVRNWELEEDDSILNGFELECWVGPRGALILQIFTKNRGIELYSTFGIPMNWDDLAEWLPQRSLPPAPKKRRD